MRSSAYLIGALALFMSACGNSSQAESRASGSGAGGSGIISTGGTGGSRVPNMADFTMTQVGGYKRGDALSGQGVMDTGLNGSGCGIVVGVVRDFKGINEAGGHPDFEAFKGDNVTTGLVAGGLGADSKPIYTGTCEATAVTPSCPYGQETTSKANFDQWYRFVDGVNKPYLIYFLFAPVGNIATFDSQYFFPLDGAGWGSLAYANDFKQHNFGFTTELHTKFQYKGGETFQFAGDDDLWIFINGKLAIDLGGLHPAATGKVDLDASAATLGLTKGNVYLLELFHAERHTTASHFRVDTTLTFVDCGIIPPDVM